MKTAGQFAGSRKRFPGSGRPSREGSPLRISVSTARRKIFEVTVDDGHGILKAKWFKGREAFLRGTFKPGRRVILTGEDQRISLSKRR